MAKVALFLIDGFEETDGHITTAKGPATTPFFALRLLELLRGKEVADTVAEAFLVPLIR